jgi:uncharacterized protein (DUF2252 family)
MTGTVSEQASQAEPTESPERQPRATRAAWAKSQRLTAPLASHEEWAPAADRDPIALLEQQAVTRIPELVPIRHGRMLASPFSYYRGAALPMAADLADTPTSGITVQLSGDAHLSNFGFFGSPERHLIFDLNDFDETLPGPWEWDVKRLAVSFEVAGRDNGYSTKQRAAITRRAARSYREAMRAFATKSMLEVWYAHLDIDTLLPQFQALLDPKRTPAVWRAVVKARAHDSLDAFTKLAEMVDGEPRIAHNPPLVVPLEHLIHGGDRTTALSFLERLLQAYYESMLPDRRHLLEQYRFVHLARKVVGVGSVGTEAWIALFVDHDHGSPLFLQVKEAQASVLEPFTAPSAFDCHGERVVVGQRLMQAASDIFLGWERVPREHGITRDYYFRQLRDWKGSADVAGMTPEGMDLWARMCGWTLARAHARSGDRIGIASYLGKSDTFDTAIARFAVTYTDQNEADHAALQSAVDDGRLEAEMGM